MKHLTAAATALAAFTVFGGPQPPSHGLIQWGRRAFERGEENARLELELTCRSTRPIDEPKLVCEQYDADGVLVKTSELKLGSILPLEVRKLYPVLETRLRPGPGKLKVVFSGKNSVGTPFAKKYTFEYGIGARQAPTMPVIHDGYWKNWSHETVNSGDTNDLARVAADFGYTHVSGNSDRYRYADWGYLPDPRGPWAWGMLAAYDEVLMAGIRRIQGMMLQKSTNWMGRTEEELWARGADGKFNPDPYDKPQLEMSEPAFAAYMRKMAQEEAKIYGAHPALTHMISMSEKRDRLIPGYGGGEERRYETETGRKIPEAVKKLGKRQFDPKEAAKLFPDGVVDDDDPHLAYYRWYWAGGDGWPNMVAAANDGVREVLPAAKRDSFQFIWEPAVRCPPLWGCGTTADFINQWCYANPEPLNIAGPCEECFAMAEGHPGQKVMIANQIIIYRMYVAPKSIPVENPPQWIVDMPDVRFPAVPPDVLTESTWAMLAKPVDALKFHGWGCIYDTKTKVGYAYTNPEVPKVHREMLRNVVAPLGPTLLDLKRNEPDVAVLESFTTAIFGQTGNTCGGWTAPSVTFAQRARLDPKVVYEEKVLSPGGLDGVKVLYLPQCKYLTKKVIAAIRDFQAQGGLVVGDELTPKAIKPDLTVPKVSFEAPPAIDYDDIVDKLEGDKNLRTKHHAKTRMAKAEMVRNADGLRRALAGRYEPFSDSSSAELVTFNRQWAETPYLFVINDRRDFGDYVGAWGKLMEKGLPCEGWVTVKDPSRRTKAVYELSKGGEVPFAHENGKVRVDVKFTTTDGRMFVFLPERIGGLEAKVSPSVARGGAIRVELALTGESGAPVPAILPVEIRAYDAAGRELDGAGYFAVKNGVCEATVLTNVNDAEGDYKVVCRDRASGLEKTFAVKGN